MQLQFVSSTGLPITQPRPFLPPARPRSGESLSSLGRFFAPIPPPFPPNKNLIDLVGGVNPLGLYQSKYYSSQNLGFTWEYTQKEEKNHLGSNLVGGWTGSSSPNRAENTKHLKPPPSDV